MAKRTVKTMVAVAASAAVLCASLAATPSAAATEAVVARYAGENRYHTAARLLEDSVIPCQIVVANGRDFPDALAGTAFGFPILLTEPDNLPPETHVALARIQDSGECGQDGPRILVLGGTAAVSDDVLSELEHYTGLEEPKRIAGANRYETAIAVARKAGTRGTVVLATGEDYPDSLAWGGVPQKFAQPIVLNDGPALRPALARFLDEASIGFVGILGGPAAVPTSIDEELSRLGRLSGRLGGVDRFATAVAIASEAYEGPDCAVLVNGDAFADALAAGPFARKAGCPILLTKRDSLPPATEQFLVDNAATIATINVVGGTAVVSEPVAQAAAAAASS